MTPQSEPISRDRSSRSNGRMKKPMSEWPVVQTCRGCISDLSQNLHISCLPTHACKFPGKPRECSTWLSRGHTSAWGRRNIWILSSIEAISLKALCVVMSGLTGTGLLDNGRAYTKASKTVVEKENGANYWEVENMMLLFPFWDQRRTFDQKGPGLILLRAQNVIVIITTNFASCTSSDLRTGEH
jgi:hypothetical protein